MVEVTNRSPNLPTSVSHFAPPFSQSVSSIRDAHHQCEPMDFEVPEALRPRGSHGASRKLYVDKAKISHANARKLTCTHLIWMTPQAL